MVNMMVGFGASNWKQLLWAVSLLVAIVMLPSVHGKHNKTMYAKGWDCRPDDHVSLNEHKILLEACLDRMGKSNNWKLDGDFNELDMLDCCRIIRQDIPGNFCMFREACGKYGGKLWKSDYVRDRCNEECEPQKPTKGMKKLSHKSNGTTGSPAPSKTTPTPTPTSSSTTTSQHHRSTHKPDNNKSTDQTTSTTSTNAPAPTTGKHTTKRSMKLREEEMNETVYNEEDD